MDTEESGWSSVQENTPEASKHWLFHSLKSRRVPAFTHFSSGVGADSLDLLIQS